MAANAPEWTPDPVLDDSQTNDLRCLVDQSFFETFSTRRNYYERKLQQSPLVLHHYTEYCTLLKDALLRVRCAGRFLNVGRMQKIILMFNLDSRLRGVFRRALRFFKEDEELWSFFIEFSTRYNITKLFNEVLDGALHFYGHKLDKLFYYWMLRLRKTKFDFDISTEMRYMYGMGLDVHKGSEFLLIEAFKLELKDACKNLKERLYSDDDFDVDTNLNHLTNLFQMAEKTFHRHSIVFYQMFELTTWSKCAPKLEKRILQFMMSTPNKDPNHWDALARNELINDAHSKLLRLRNCIGKYKEGVLVVQTNEMWNKFIEFVFEQSLKLNMESKIRDYHYDEFVIAKGILLKHCIWYIHKNKKYEPSHYICWIKKFNSYMAEEMINGALERYPNDMKVLNKILRKSMKINQPLAFELFKANARKLSNTIWLRMVDVFSNDSCFKDILSMVFEDDSIYSDEVRSSLASKYLHWMYQNTSLKIVRYAYYELIKNSNCNKKLYKAMINIEMKEPSIDMIKIRQHFILACMQFGDFDTDLWTMRANFELKHGTRQTYFCVCFWASNILRENNTKFSNILAENNGYNGYN